MILDLAPNGVIRMKSRENQRFRSLLARGADSTISRHESDISKKSDKLQMLPDHPGRSGKIEFANSRVAGEKKKSRIDRITRDILEIREEI